METKKYLFIEKSFNNNSCIIKLNGFLDAHTSKKLEEKLEETLKEKCYNILLDLEYLTYISSAGLGVFILHIEEIRKNKGDIILVNIPSNIFSNIIKPLGFDSVFKIVKTQQEALTIFNI